MDIGDGTLGEWLQQLRTNAGRSRMQVAEAGGINHRTVERVETGFHSNPTWSTIARILKGIGIQSLTPVYRPADRKGHGQPTLDETLAENQPL